MTTFRTGIILMALALPMVALIADADIAPAAPVPARAAPLPRPAAPNPAALDGMKPGLWTVHGEEAGALPQRLCLDDPRMLAQLRHADASCARTLVDGDGRQATVRYSCPGAGWGRTALHVDSDSHVRIETQGIADNAPFAYRADARRIGDCDE